MIFLVVSFVVLASVSLALAVALVAAARFFFRREEDWRQRELHRVDQIWQRAGYAPLTVERENVLRLPDVEAPQETWIDTAMRNDRIQEEIEQLHPEVAGMHPDVVREMYPGEWKRFEKQAAEDATPLRV